MLPLKSRENLSLWSDDQCMVLLEHAFAALLAYLRHTHEWSGEVRHLEHGLYRLLSVVVLVRLQVQAHLSFVGHLFAISNYEVGASTAAWRIVYGVPRRCFCG